MIFSRSDMFLNEDLSAFMISR